MDATQTPANPALTTTAAPTTNEPAPAAAAASASAPATESGAAPAPAAEFVPYTAADFTVEGLDLASETAAKFLEQVNGLKLDKGIAEQMLALHATELGSQREAMQKALQESLLAEQQKAWETTKESWVKQAKEMPELGGANFDATLSVVAKALDKFGTPAVREAFDLTGAGDHPEIIRFIHSMAKHLVEQPPVLGTPPGAGKTLAQKLYPGA